MTQKKAIIYVRVSTDEQADKGYSLKHQEERLQNYCSLQGIEVVGFYREDHSAKAFDRPQFNRLLEFLKKNKRFADYLLFLKWDRFYAGVGVSISAITIIVQQAPTTEAGAFTRQLEHRLLALAEYITEYPHYFTPTNPEWKSFFRGKKMTHIRD